MDATCTHTNTRFDPVSRNVICKDCGAVTAHIKPKAGVKIPIRATIRKTK